MTTQQKYCARCQTIKDLEDFRPSPHAKKFKVHSYCHECVKKTNKKYYESNKAAILEKAKTKTKKYKQKHQHEMNAPQDEKKV